MPNTEPAQIKAKELIEKFKEMICCSTNHCTYGSIKEDYEYDMNLAAKQCAITCLSEIESALTDYGRATDELQNMDRTFNFYQQVLTNINNLK